LRALCAVQHGPAIQYSQAPAIGQKDELCIVAFNHSQLWSALLEWLAEPLVEAQWTNDWEPGIDRLLIYDQGVHTLIRQALSSLGLKLSLCYACNGAKRVPWGLRYGLGTACPFHKDLCPTNQWSVLIGVSTQDEHLYVQSETRIQPIRVANGDIILFQGSIFDHWTDGAAVRGRLVIAWHVTLSESPRNQ
jgi:hypothetical protein